MLSRYVPLESASVGVIVINQLLKLYLEYTQSSFLLTAVYRCMYSEYPGRVSRLFTSNRLPSSDNRDTPLYINTIRIFQTIIHGSINYNVFQCPDFGAAEQIIFPSPPDVKNPGFILPNFSLFLSFQKQFFSNFSSFFLFPLINPVFVKCRMFRMLIKSF